jgi:hypothetical protein
MNEHSTEEEVRLASFGRRKVRQRACVADGKHHIRAFLVEALEELGFVACACADAAEFPGVLEAQRPDLAVLGLSAGGIEAGEMLKILAARAFEGKVLLLGPPAFPATLAIRESAEALGVALLPKLDTPFSETGLRNTLAALLPGEPAPDPPIRVDEAMSGGWLELWYQPEIDIRSLTVRRAEALVRIRHPTWGAYRRPTSSQATAIRIFAHCRSS